MLIAGTIRKNIIKTNKGKLLLDILTSSIRPIILHYEVLATKLIIKKITFMNDVTMAPYLKEELLKMKELEKELTKHTRLQLGFETIFQVTANTMLLFYAHSATKTRSGLSLLFNSDSDVLMGISLPSEIILAILLAMNLVSFVNVQMNGIVEGYASNYSLSGKSIILLGIICTTIVRIASIVLYFSTTLGLFDQLRHYQGKVKLKV